MVCIDLLDDTDEALASGNIDAFSPGVIVQIVSVAHTGNAPNHRPALRVEHHKLGRLSGYYEHPVIRFIQGHWVIGLAGLQRPLRNLVRRAIDHHNLRFGGDIAVDHRS